MILKDITEEVFEKLESCKDDYVDLYVSGSGGCVRTLQRILYIINSDPDRFTIITADHNASANFSLLFLAKCKVVILADTVGEYHHMYHQRELLATGKPRDIYEEFMIGMMDTQLEERLDKELELFPKEQLEVNSGRSVYFNSHRIKKLLTKDWTWFRNELGVNF